MCSVICFLWAQRLDANDIHRGMCLIYGDKCFSRSAMCLCCKMFARGQKSVVVNLLRNNLAAQLFLRPLQACSNISQFSRIV